MGFRVRRSFKVAPGVRLNVARTGVGASVGVRGARYAVHSSGRRTTMLGNPIFGVGYMKSTRSRGSRPAKTEPRARSAGLRKPGLLAPRSEKALYAAIQSRNPGAVLEAGKRFAENRCSALAIAAVMLLDTEPQRSAKLLGRALSEGDPSKEPFMQTSASGALLQVAVAPGISASIPFDRDALALLLAELHQAQGRLDKAIDLVEGVQPTSYAAVSLAELYCESGRHREVIELTDGVVNEDDVTALLLVYRGVALRETGVLEASRHALTQVLRFRSRAREIRHLALSERSRTHEQMGRRAAARKDLERILADDTQAPGIRERLADLQST